MFKLTLSFLGLIAMLTVQPVHVFSQDSATDRSQSMDKLWGENVVKLRAENAERGQLFDEGNYAMFIHWGLYSQLGNKVDGKTYYGIGEWIMNKRMADIPIPEYKRLAGTFHPVDFDAKQIAQLAKDAGMKYIVITAKHHDGFAMYHSKACDFNIVDATPWNKDPMKELATACREAGLGFGFYYSHNQDWTFPGGGNGPGVDEQGKRATFDDYFVKKCLPQVKEITTEYGPIEIVWFDTPGKMPKHYVEQLVDVVHKNQPHAMVSGRAGHGLGDYQTLGDMEVPRHNIEGLWESVDTTNDSWAYAWYDEYWKSPKEILKRLIACVGRGGTYMLNIGPRGDGAVPERAKETLRHSGHWIQRYPQVVYAAQASPWQHALPWGDVTRKDNNLFLCVFEWPRNGQLYLPNLKTKITSATMLRGDEHDPISWSKSGDWVVLEVPAQAPEELVSVIELQLASEPVVDPAWTLDPDIKTEILAEFATVEDAEQSEKRWMEKFGEWKGITHVHQWEAGGKASWEVDVLEPGDYNVELTYAGEGRLVWSVSIEGGESIQNQQNSSHNYQAFPIGWIHFPKPGRYNVFVKCVEGDLESASLKSIDFKRVF
ncbi:alpha-L-fucosidase [Novipirellula artificiosorum]|uniref:alpha-L-fucosidase n=1 Tax=Novipirellula artificiosorum TaxID=2528016 RepID=A0A5C6DGT5_9BACT|nr:alpha-L-fucosidase [Novipirellula artificiosorum]TWU35037.1 Alpha-L-fucosidase [Novipirellula artificiosorum]